MVETRTAQVEERIEDIDVSAEMRKSFLEYSYSVIYARALPDARDGLKPVQRRILFQMDQMGLRPEKPHVKSSRVVGDVMGRLHPHGDSAIYDATVRLAQPFTMRVPLIDGHGNFGSLDDGPAAARYTEVRMSPAAMAMVADLGEDVVDMVPNYDGSTMQPEVLPAAIPNLLVNGTSGIAVGMATNMPPHNLVEVIAGARHLLAHPEATLDDVMRFIPGPDLPCGGKIVGLDGVREAYETGRGTFRTRATAKIEKLTARKRGIVITELPYMVGPEKVIEKIKDVVNARKIEGITAVQNYTDRTGLRLVIEVKNSVNPDAVLAALYKHTPLEDSYGINNVALVDGQPRTLGLVELLRVFLNHRIEVVRRRSEYRLKKAHDQLHLVEGLLIAIIDIDEVIAVIRSSDDSQIARERLQMIFDLSEVQAQHILDLRLRRLTKFERIELEAQRDELQRQIADLEDILGSQARLESVVSAELADVARAYGTPRRTILLEGETSVSPAKMELEIADGPCWVMLSGTGLVARTSDDTLPARSGGRSAHDALRSLVGAQTRQQVGVVTSTGMLHRLDVVDVPAVPPTDAPPSLAGGTRLVDLLHLEDGETPVGLVSLLDDAAPILLATAEGKIKRVRAEFPAKDSFDVISLSDGDRVIGAGHATDSDVIVLVTSDAQLLRFGADAVRPQGRSGQGIAGIRVNAGASVIAAGVVPSDDVSGSLVVTVAGADDALPGTMPGTAKVTPLDRFPAKGRATGGVRAQRFLHGENCLMHAWVGPAPARALASGGSPIDLPEVDERRDGSGQALPTPIVAIG